MKLKIGMNECCWCGSDLKYKKCCFKLIDQDECEMIEFVTEPIPHHEFQDGRPEISDRDEYILELLQEQLLYAGELITSEDIPFFAMLNQLNEKYPHHPIILKYLYKAYSILDQQGKINELMLEMKEKCPTCLFGKATYATWLIEQGQLEQAFEPVSYTHLDVYKRQSTKFPLAQPLFPTKHGNRFLPLE